MPDNLYALRLAKNEPAPWRGGTLFKRSRRWSPIDLQCRTLEPRRSATRETPRCGSGSLRYSVEVLAKALKDHPDFRERPCEARTTIDLSMRGDWLLANLVRP
jgi:hypothetical protein